MDKDIETILANNFKETLRQFQNYLVWGTITSISYYLIISDKQSTTNINLPVLGPLGTTNSKFGALLSLAAFWILGAMASYALQRAIRIANKFDTRPEILKALVTFPSIATEIYPGVKFVAGILPIIVIVAARIEIWDDQYSTYKQLMKLGFLLVPYLVILLLLFNKSIPFDKPGRN